MPKARVDPYSRREIYIVALACQALGARTRAGSAVSCSARAATELTGSERIHLQTEPVPCRRRRPQAASLASFSAAAARSGCGTGTDRRSQASSREIEV